MKIYNGIVQNHTALPARLLLTALLLMTTHLVTAATVAGRVVFATGSPQASDAAGAVRALKRTDDVYAGDTLITDAKSRLQVSFVDGAYVSVQPGSEYRIDEYRYSGKPDGSEKAIYSLLKGGIRAVTGLIGKKNHDAYKVNTAVATIGIRGTGHNTRICQGDCPGKPDGLYHNTWEGVTYVENDADVVDVPTGKGVYVRDLSSPIQFLNQPSAVTAVETGKEREEEDEKEHEDEETYVAGEQRDEQGDELVLTTNDTVPVPSTVIKNQVFIAIHPDPTQTDGFDVVSGSGGSLFVNGNGQGIGALFTEDDAGTLERTFGTVDINAMLGGDDPAAVAEVQSLLATADASLVDKFKQKPATVAEYHLTPGGIGWGRFANGFLVSVDDHNGTDLHELTGNQSVHFIFGPMPQSFPGTGRAVYNFVGGTQSTSVSGATIGNGVTGGQLAVDFGGSSATIAMHVDHAGSFYTVSGDLGVNLAKNEIFDLTNGVTAITTTLGSACIQGCITHIDGGFAGAPDPGGFPLHAGIVYDIHESDIITGAAGFTIPPPP